MGQVRRPLAFFLVAALVLAPALVVGKVLLDKSQSEGGGAPAVLRVASRPLSGSVVYPDRKTAVAEASVRVWSVETGSFVLETATDAGGAFELPSLDEGSYILVVGDRVMTRLSVEKDADPLPDGVCFVVPHGKAVFAQMPLEQKAAVLSQFPAQGPEEGGIGLLNTVLISAATSAVVIGVVDATDIIEDEETRIVSP